jgi:hypothetical protein
MLIPVRELITKNRLELSIEKFASLENPTQGDLNAVIVEADLQKKIDDYRKGAQNMDEVELENEAHRSDRLGAFLGPKPHSECHPHAIVSGGDPRAAAARAVLAWHKMRVDDPFNGCWLPRNTAAVRKMPRWLKGAVPHSRIHRNGYYFWLNSKISLDLIETAKQLKPVLTEVAARLQTCTFPKYVMKKAEELKKLGMGT